MALVEEKRAGCGSGQVQIFLIWIQIEELPTSTGCDHHLSQIFERSHRALWVWTMPTSSCSSNVPSQDTQREFKSFQVEYLINHKQIMYVREIWP